MSLKSSEATSLGSSREPAKEKCFALLKLKPAAAQHRVLLLAGEKLKVYVEYFFNEATSNFSDQLQLDWSDDSSSQVAAGKFSAAAGQSSFAQVTNESKMTQTSTWLVPFYHEIFYRAKESGMAVEKFMVRTGAPARVEIYNEDNGELLAVDAEGMEFTRERTTCSPKIWIACAMFSRM